VPAKPSAQGTQAPAGATYTTPAGDPSRWLWPTDGRLLSTFRANDPSRKGIDIAGSAGQPVVASAAGQVVYSGSGLIGYGELIIIKHSDRMLSAYAHNSKRLATEGQQVTAGSKIAEMGTNDRNQAVLHFEIRLNGTPVDPLKYLPKK
jgi:lipoprotein NlpD